MVRRCTMAEDEQGGMTHELSAVIQNMVRSRISQNWPRVRAHECRTQRASLQPGEWILAAGATAAQNKWVGLVKRVGVLPFHARQRDYLLPLSALPVLVHWFTEVQGTGHYVRRSGGDAATEDLVWPAALLAVGFSMTSVPSLPLDWSYARRRPGGKRRLGSAYVMPQKTISQLAGLM